MRKLEFRRIIIFLAFTFILTYTWTISLIWPRVFGQEIDVLTQEETAVRSLLTAVLMFFPAIGVLFTRLVTGEGFKNAMLRFNLRGNVRYYLVAWFGPMVLTFLGMIVYYLIFPSEFTIAQFKNLSTDQAGMMALTVVLMLFSPLLNLIPCLGEEWGWRGYLLPKVAEQMKFLPTVLLTGFIWGIWHAPIVVTGHNYGLEYFGYPWLGIFAMCIFCTIVGTLFSYITLRTKSCWPAVLAHGALNGTSGLGMLFYDFSVAGDMGNQISKLPYSFIGPLPVGIIGGIAYIAVAVWIVQKSKKAK